MLNPYFDRYDICEAHAVLEADWNLGGWLHERPSNMRRKEASACQLNRIQFKSHGNLSFKTLTKNGRAIYLNATRKFGLRH